MTSAAPATALLWNTCCFSCNDRPAPEAALNRYMDEVHNPASPNFHHWLTAEQFGALYGPASQDIQTITDWLTAQGFTVNQVYPSGMVIDFSGSVSQVRTSLHTEIHRLNVNGEEHYANMTDPQIPAALAPAIAGIVSLHDFSPHAMHTARSEYTFTSDYTNQAVVPADLATIYNLNPLFASGIAGQGQTIVLIEDSDIYRTSDFTTFRSTFGLNSYFSGSLTDRPSGAPLWTHELLRPRSHRRHRF